MQTTIIKNGICYDGSGDPGKKKDLIIKNGKVVDITEHAQTPTGCRVIDANGKWVTPGFLDIHTHYDAEVEVMPGLQESLRHGTTTVVMGNCSISTAIGRDEDMIDLFCRVENMPAQVLTDWIKDKITWNTISEYYDHLDTLALGPNVASFIGHSNIRIAAMGVDRSFKVAKATSQEKQIMENLLEEAMEAGYLGMSIDMLPFHRWAGIFSTQHIGSSVPSQQAAVSEYKQLSHILRKYNRVLQATPNALDKTSALQLMSMSSGLLRQPLKTTIVAAMDLKSNSRIHQLITTLGTVGNRLLNADMKFQALSMPFLNYGEGPITPLFEEFPSMVKIISADREARRSAFKDTTFRKWFRKDWHHKTTSVFPRLLEEMTVIKCPDTSLVGQTFKEIANRTKMEGLECFMDLMIEHDTDIIWKCTAANHRDDIRLKLLAHDTTIPGFNDSGAHNVNMAFHDGALQTLRQAQAHPTILSIEKAIYRLTKMPAEWLGIDAGIIQKGHRADICIIDPDKLQTHLSEEPIEDYHPMLQGAFRYVKRSDGVVAHVWVNGQEVFSAELGFISNIGKRKYGQLLKSLH